MILFLPVNHLIFKMKVVALISGGKDSTFNMMQCIAAGHEIVALANLVPHSRTEIDSYMYQSVGHEAIDLIASALDLPLFKRETKGLSNQHGKLYKPTENDEVEDLYLLLEDVKKNVDIEAVSVGAILSDYQRVRVENVCVRLGLVPLAYLWQRNERELLDEMIKCEVDAIIVKVAALGLDPQKHLGRSLSLMEPQLINLHEKYGLHICGEGGEYETVTLDCPLFKSRIIIEDSEIVMHSNDTIAPVGFLKFNKLGLELKLPALDLNSRLEGLPLKGSEGYLTDQEETFEFEVELAEPNVNSKKMEDNHFECNFRTNTQNVVHKVTFAKSKEGWLWIGGVQGYSDSPAEAMAEAMSIIKSTLEQNQHDIQDVCSVNMFVGNMSHYAELNELYVETFNYPNPPTRACVQVPFDKACPVRIEALSWKKSTENVGEPSPERHTMHVQSRSHWAPANIGPYSQAVKIGEFIRLAGQIGLVPGSMELVDGGIKSQCRLALRHIQRLLCAMDPNVNLRDVVQGVCYVTDMSHIECARQLWEGKTNNAIVNYVVVAGLPKNALIEWHVWAHKHNNQFEYEERGKRIEDYSISLYRRVNYENNVAAVVCHVEYQGDKLSEITEKAFTEAISYSIQKLQQGHENEETCIYGIKVFYLVKCMDENVLIHFFEDLMGQIPLVYTLVPVLHLKNRRTLLSICGIRNE